MPISKNRVIFWYQLAQEFIPFLLEIWFTIYEKWRKPLLEIKSLLTSFHGGLMKSFLQSFTSLERLLDTHESRTLSFEMSDEFMTIFLCKPFFHIPSLVLHITNEWSLLLGNCWSSRYNFIPQRLSQCNFIPLIYSSFP